MHCGYLFLRIIFPKFTLNTFRTEVLTYECNVSWKIIEDALFAIIHILRMIHIHFVLHSSTKSTHRDVYV